MKEEVVNYKLLAIILITLTEAFELFKDLLIYRSRNNALPENVRDVYDEERYKVWRNYEADKVFVSIFSGAFGYIVSLLLLIFDVYALVGEPLGTGLLSSVVVTIFDVLAGTLAGLFFDFYNTMKVEARYGFNRTSLKTFIVDKVKETIIGLVVSVLLTVVFFLLYKWLGDFVIIAFAAVFFGFVLLISFCYPYFSRIFNKFSPLPEGELKTKLTEMLEGHGYKVREISIMDASKRSTKANAYFAGFGKTKTVVLYDTLLDTLTTEEICAVFAHEMGHGLHRDTLKNQLISIVNTIIIALSVWLCAKCSFIYGDFGFSAVNYGFGIIIATEVLVSFISPILGLFTNFMSRRAEYLADNTAKEEGYGEALASALKKLAGSDFDNLAPSPLIVKLCYSHPTISQRIDNLKDCGNGEKQ